MSNLDSQTLMERMSSGYVSDYIVKVYEHIPNGSNFLKDKRQYSGTFQSMMDYVMGLMHRVSDIPSHAIVFNQDTGEEHQINSDGSYIILKKQFNEGGEVEDGENKEMLENQVINILHHAEELKKVLPNVKEVEAWVITKIQRSVTDLADVTHYLEGETKDKYADGGMMGQSITFYEGNKYKMPNDVIFVVGEKIKDEFGTAIELIEESTGQKFVLDIMKASNFLKKNKAVQLSKMAEGGEVGEYNAMYFKQSVTRDGSKIDTMRERMVFSGSIESVLNKALPNFNPLDSYVLINDRKTGSVVAKMTPDGKAKLYDKNAKVIDEIEVEQEVEKKEDEPKKKLFGLFAEGGIIGGLTADESIYLYIKRAIVQKYREKYLKPAGLWNTAKSKDVEQSLIKKGFLNNAGAITEVGKNRAKEVDSAIGQMISRDYISSINLPSKYKEIVDKFESYDKMAEGGIASENANDKFYKWYVDWLKGVNEYVNVSISIPNEFSSPIKDGKGKIVILDVIEKKGDTDAKKYMNEILEKADEFGVSIYLQPIPRTHNLKSQEHKNKITKDYLIKYYQKFGFKNMDGGFMVREPKMADGGQIDQNISSNVKLYHKYRFDSDAAASNGEDGKSMRLLDKAEDYRDEANKLIKEYNKNNKTNFTFQDFDRDGSLREGISSGLKVPTEYTNPEAEEGRYKYVVEVKYPYNKESFITNFSTSEKDRDPSYQAALQVIKDAQKNDDFKEGHIMFDFYIKGFGRSYTTIFHTDKKKMAEGGIMAKGGITSSDDKMKFIAAYNYAKDRGVDYNGSFEEFKESFSKKAPKTARYSEKIMKATYYALQQDYDKMAEGGMMKEKEDNILALTLNGGNDHALVKREGKWDARIIWILPLSKNSKHKVGDLINLRLEGDDYMSDWKKFQFHQDFTRFATEKQKKDYYKIIDEYSGKDKMMGGGDVKFKDKVKSVKESLLKRKKVAKKVQKDYGKTYSPKEAEESAKRIVGAMTAKERLMAKNKKTKK